MKKAVTTRKKGLPKVIMSSNLFPVVGIGASAGGLEAFKKLLKAINENSGMAYVLVQHLDPNHESFLPAILQRVTKIPVLEISDEIEVLPNHIYILPSNKMLIATDGVLQLSPRPEKSKNERNLPIDLFFTSLAEIHQTHAIGVVLSGTASDGTKGLKAIKDQGGITFAQDEASAAFDGMPSSAILAGVVDFILPPEEIPQKLLDIKNKVNLTDEELLNIAVPDDEAFKQILYLLRTRKGTDFTYYKQTTIRRRIMRRIALNKNDGPVAYLNYLREHKTELDALYQDMLIPVTTFFRDTKVFDNLCESVFPHIVKNNISGEPIRVWVAGCSTGQEAYSLAICLKEFLGSKQEKVQIFATDISEPAILKARKGLYSKSEVEEVIPYRLQDFFTKADGGYQVNKAIREICVFAVHNFLKDPPFGKINLVSCRNVLIYMEPYLQKRALTTFHYALKSKGVLLLGKSETTGSAPDLFAPHGKNDKLFARKDVPGRFMHVASQRSEQSMQDLNTTSKTENSHTDIQKTVDEIVLKKYTPAGVVVDDAMEIIHFRGNTSYYLEQGTGKPSHNLLKMAKDGLAFELRNLLHKVKKENKPVVKENILIDLTGGQGIISIEAIPLPNSIEPQYLILFHNNNSIGNKPSLINSKKTLSRKANGDDKDLRIQQLEDKLTQTHEDIRSITEDQEAANEELQSANEELLSGSEELQSLNEELESSKEELQSTNEELTVLNQELSSLNEQVNAARYYAESIVTTIREPLLVLNKNLRVKTANSAFYKTFRVNELETEGLLIFDLGNKQWNIPALRTLLEEVLHEKKNFIDFEMSHDFPSIGQRTMLLNAREMTGGKTEEKLILVAIEDITEQRLHQLKETELLNRFQNLVKQAPVAMCILKGEDYAVDLANDYYLELVEKRSNFIDKPFFQSLPELKSQGIKELLDNVRQSGTPYYGNELEMHILRNKKREQGFFNFVYHPMREHGKSVTGIIIVVTEVTEQVIARKRMETQATMVKEMLMTAPGFVCTLSGPNHVYELVNERYLQLFGRRNIQGKSMLEALPELEGQGLDKLLDKVYISGEPYLGIDIPLTLARDEGLSPELRYFNFSYQPMYDENKKINSILVFGYEVTEQVVAKNEILKIQQEYAMVLEEKVKKRTLELSEANNALEGKNDELNKMNIELQSFAYVSSHDLQEPLRKIQSFAARILEREIDKLSEKGKDDFERMRSAAGRMQQLIQDLLAFSHLTVSERKFENTDLNKIAQDIKTELKEALEEKHATVEIGEMCEAAVIPFQFRQVMFNLINNALKFSKKEQAPHILINSTVKKGDTLNDENPALMLRLALEKNYCNITIADNGIGFEPKYSERIFGVFQKLHGKEEYPGTGIGLAIVKKIVENHNGIITATGKRGEGAVFDIYIPVLKKSR